MGGDNILHASVPKSAENYLKISNVSEIKKSLLYMILDVDIKFYFTWKIGG